MRIKDYLLNKLEYLNYKILIYWNFFENRIDLAFGRCTLSTEINWSSVSIDWTGKGFAGRNR